MKKALVIASLLGAAACSGDKESTTARKSALTVPVPPVTQFVILASRSASFDDRTSVTGGHIGVAAGATNTLTAGSDTHIGVGQVLVSPQVVLRDRATTGEIGSNVITASPSAVTGPRSAYVAPPTQPAPGTITAGTAAVTVNSGQTVNLAPGAFGAVTVNGTLNLSGGLYRFQSLQVNNSAARVVALASSTVRIVGTLTALDRARVLTAGSQGASALRLIVGGATNAVTLGNDVQLTALVVARGDFRAGDRLIFNGSIAGRDVIIGHDCQVGFNGGFQCGSNASCTDNNTCTTDTCGDALCTRVVLANGTACNDGNACTQTDRCQGGTCVGSNPVACVASDQCHAVGACAPATGVCSNPRLPDRTPCNDGNACTLSDHCGGGVCAGTARTCFASDTCHDVGVCDTTSGICSNPLRADGTCNGSGPPVPPYTPIPPRKMPKPPTAVGCYFYDFSGWHSTPCMPPDVVKATHGVPTLALSSDRFTSGGVSNQIPLVYGQVETVFPTVGTITDQHVPSICDGTPAEQPTGPNRWSIQANTNYFDLSNPAGSSWIQFVMQATGTTNSICLWEVANGGRVVADYTPHCVPVNISQRPGGLIPFDSGNIAGVVDAASGTLSVVAELTWVGPSDKLYYAVTNPDTLGLAGNWFTFDGSVIGEGCASNAQFTDTTVLTRLAVSSCPGDEEADSIDNGLVCAPPDLQPNVTVQSLQTTGETSNLIALTPSTGPATFLNRDLAITNQLSTTTGSCFGPDFVFVKDNDRDNGGQPSSLGGQPFWESPDLFVVPAGTPVDVDAISTETIITPGGNFDVWVRVNNDYACNQVTAVKTRIYIADPAAISTTWVAVTGDQYLGDPGAPNGDNVPAGTRALLGPFPFTAPADTEGHKCLLAAIQATGEPPVANNLTFDAKASNQVCQRNVQFSSCNYPLTNGTSSPGSVQITVTAGPPELTPSLSNPTPAFAFTFDDPDSSWFNVWNVQTGNGTTFAVTTVAGRTTVRLGTNRVTLNAVPLNAGESRTAVGNLNLPDGVSGTLFLETTFTGSTGTTTINNGATCRATGSIIG